MMNQHKPQMVLSFENGTRQISEQNLLIEDPLAIHVEGEPYSVVMRTPGEEIFHVAGFCLAEGLVDHPDDFASIGHCPDMDANVVYVTLKPERREKISALLKRKSFVSQTSCGICGKLMIDDLCQVLSPITNNNSFSFETMLKCAGMLLEHQHLFQKTFASHGVVLFDLQVSPIFIAEDVGRHNALDKAIGKAFMNNSLDMISLAVFSSRISYELVQKAARAKIPVIIGMSQPTTLAVELGRTVNMTIATYKRNRLSIFCGEERIYGG